jgi:hypothetical protein
MKTTLPSLAALLLAAAIAFLASFTLEAQAPPAPITIGVALPHGQLGDGAANVPAALRQSVVEQLHRPGVETVALDASTPEQLDAEARSKHCTHILYTNLEQKHAGGGLLHKLAPMAGMLSMGAMAGAAGHMGGGGVMSAVAQSAAQNAAQSAVSNSLAATQQQAMAQMTGAQQSGIKRGDTVSLEYRLVQVGSTTPIQSATLQGKADADGQDVLTPLIGQLAGSVSATGSAAAPATPPAPGGASATAAGAAATAGAAASGTAAASSGTSRFGGLFGHHQAPQTAAAGAPPDCAQIAAVADAHVSMEACQKMMATQKAYDSALADPKAARPGDEQMSCDQIIAEMKQQQFATPDKGQLADAQSALADEQAMIAKHQKEAAVQQAKEQAMVDAASTTDRVTEMASMGMVRGRALETTEKTLDAENKAMNRRMLDESKPTDTRAMNSTADLMSGAGTQLTANPRLARLTQLANTHHCHGG